MGLDHDGDSLPATLRLQQDGHLISLMPQMFNRMRWFPALLALVLVGLAVAGGIKNYSSVPYWDMWDGYLDFFMRVSNGDWSAWWGQHNEHRIVLARLLFWMDIAWFQGTSLFLIVMNYLLVAMAFGFFYAMAKEQFDLHGDSCSRYLIVPLICGWLFSWSQHDNLTWAFQSQFFLAQLLPLFAFYSLHKSATPSLQSFRWFLVACAAGILSIGTMANGILTLPLMFVMALVVRIRPSRTALIGLLGLITILVYFLGYHSNNLHGSLPQAVTQNPVALVRYVLLYVGGPFYYLVGKSTFGLAIAQLAGAFLIICAAYIALRQWRSPIRNSLSVALLTFILYIGGTALGTGGGRLIFGLGQALSSRYITPALMVWAALLVLYLPIMLNLQGRRKIGMLLILSFLFALMLSRQLTALRQPENDVQDRRVGALALTLGIADKAQLGLLYPNTERLLILAQQAQQKGLSIFGTAPLYGLPSKMGQVENMGTSDLSCNGSMTSTIAIPDVTDYVSVNGRLDSTAANSNALLQFQDPESGRVAGYAISGIRADGLHESTDKASAQTVFKGYLLAQYAGKTLRIADPGINCTAEIEAPAILFSTHPWPGDAAVVSVTQKQVLKSEWLGSDYAKTTIPGIHVSGSLIQGDQDTGSITLSLRKGDRLLFRSGPTGGRQFVEIPELITKRILLPVAPDWIVLDFSTVSLPDAFTITLTDDGDRWGEWSAIAIKE
jgi:hypothetical protein